MVYICNASRRVAAGGTSSAAYVRVCTLPSCVRRAFHHTQLTQCTQPTQESTQQTQRQRTQLKQPPQRPNHKDCRSGVYSCVARLALDGNRALVSRQWHSAAAMLRCCRPNLLSAPGYSCGWLLRALCCVVSPLCISVLAACRGVA